MSLIDIQRIRFSDFVVYLELTGEFVRKRESETKTQIEKSKVIGKSKK